MKRITVLGATSLIGHFLLPELHRTGWQITAVSRKDPPENQKRADASVRWLRHDISTSPLSFTCEEIVVSLAPLWVLGDMLSKAAHPPARILAFSSTSVITKRNSPNPGEQYLATRLAAGEDALRRYAGKHAIDWTILRPTLVYGAGLDHNVSMIARFIRRIHFFPLIGTATGKRMPVHAMDLSQAIIQCLESSATGGQIYTVSGGETLSYKEMVCRIFAALGSKQRIIPVPTLLARGLIRGAALLPQFSGLTPEMAERTSQDLVFDHDAATRDFGYAPRSFRPTRADLLQSDPD